MKIYKTATVFEEALTRIRWLYDEFPNVVVSVSGGKDSTVVLHLAKIVAREKGRLPVRVVFVDQEAEWQATEDMVREIMYDPEVLPMWYQMPIRLFNATSASDHWLHCWNPADADVWIHPQDPIAIKVNEIGTDRFHKTFPAILRHVFPGEPACYIAGVRTEESPSRALGLTNDPAYKWATWGKILDKKVGHFTMYPIYDWSYLDVWKAINDNGWHYNRLYDLMYRYGIPVHEMRVSNVHHETAVRSLFMLQEIEPETWNRLTVRLAGVDMAGKFGYDSYFPKELPYMFASWREYRDYLLEKLIDNEDWRVRFRKGFAYHDRLIREGRLSPPDKMYQIHVRAILVNDWEGITLENASASHKVSLAKARLLARSAAAAEV